MLPKATQVNKIFLRILSLVLSVFILVTAFPTFEAKAETTDTITKEVSAATMAAPVENDAEITKNGNKWTLENDTMKSVISFGDNSIDMISFYNKIADVEYLTGSGERTLFYYDFGSSKVVSANDGGWTLGTDVIDDINLYEMNWGKKLEITISRELPKKVQVTLAFEIFNGDAGLRYQCYIKNNEAENLTIENSDVLKLNFPNESHTGYCIAGSKMEWTNTRGSLDGTNNGVMVYDGGDGWSLSPEINCQADDGIGDSNPALPPFGKIYAWTSGEESVRFTTNPDSLQLVLFPGEEMEYLGINLTVFQGDQLDGRLNIEKHFQKRYKYIDPTMCLSINDWLWFRGGNRSDSYYRNIVVPTALSAGIDRISVDDYWNVEFNGWDNTVERYGRDSVEPLASFTTDLESLSDHVVDSGLKIGYWFSLTGGFHWDGRDLADWSNIEYKIDQMGNTLIGKYNSSWQQLAATGFVAAFQEQRSN